MNRQEIAGVDRGPVAALTAIVPAFNEEETLVSAVTAIRANLRELGVPFEIVIVNDGSTDGTARIAEQFAADDRSIVVVHHERNRRIGAALKTGAETACHGWAVLVPVDNPIPATELRRLCAAAGDAAIAVGYREGRPGYPWWMRAASRVYHELLSALFGMRLRDFNWCCLYRTDVLRAVPIRHQGILGLPELLIRAHRDGYRLVEVPLSMRARISANRRPTVSRVRTMASALLDVLVLCWELRVTGSPAATRIPVGTEERTR